MGAVFIGYGLLSSKQLKFIALIGIGLFTFGLYVLVTNRRAFGSGSGP